MKRKKREKNFDALAFKRKAQQRLYKATRGMTWEEEVDYYHQMALKGPFSKFVQKYSPYPSKILKAGEKHAQYR